MCLQVLSRDVALSEPELNNKMSGLHSTALLLLRQFLLGPASTALMQLEMENTLISKLLVYLDRHDTYVQLHYWIHCTRHSNFQYFRRHLALQTHIGEPPHRKL
jgi:hypothetical protein